MRKARRWARGGSRLAAVVSVLTLLVLGVGPHTGAYRPITVLTQSMQPTMPAGSVVFVTPIGASTVRVGDVITYRIPVEDRRVVTHRVVEILEHGPAPVVRTKGDATNAVDSWTTKLAAGPVWKVRTSVPYLGFGLQALQQPDVRRATVMVLPALLALFMLAQIWTGGTSRSRRGRHRRPSRWAATFAPATAR